MPLAVHAALANCRTAQFSQLNQLFTAVLTRYSSFSTLNAAIHAPILALIFADQQIATLAGFMTVLIFLRHYANIRRLLKGEEPAIGKS